MATLLKVDGSSQLPARSPGRRGRRRRVRAALFPPIVNPELAPIAELPVPSFTLRASHPADRAQQSLLFAERSDV